MTCEMNKAYFCLEAKHPLTTTQYSSHHVWKCSSSLIPQLTLCKWTSVVSLKESHILSPIFGLKISYHFFSSSALHIFQKHVRHLGLHICHLNKFYLNINEFHKLNVTWHYQQSVKLYRLYPLDFNI